MKGMVTAMEFSEDQVKVLNYVSAGLGAPEGIRSDLRCAYQEMLDGGMVERVTIYRLTDAGETALTIERDRRR